MGCRVVDAGSLGVEDMGRCDPGWERGDVEGQKV